MNEQQLIQLEIAARRSSIERSLLEEARIQREYTSMLHNVRRDIESFYGRYAIDEGVSISEARRRASATDISSTMDRIERLCDAGLGDRAMQEVRLLELTMTVNRLENLRANIGLSVLEGYDRLERQYGAMLTERTADEIERRAHELGLRQAHLNYDHIVKNPMGQANYLDRLWANQEYFRSDIEKALKRAMIGGKSLDELAKDIQKKFGGAEYQAKRLLRTEVKRVETEAFKELMLENGIKYYKYATVDSNACAECKHMNGRRYKVENLEAGVNAPPLHPNCRCSTIPWGTGWYKWNKGNTDINAGNRGAGGAASVMAGESAIIGQVDFNNKSQIMAELDAAEIRFAGLDHEECITITSDGNIWYTVGSEAGLDMSGITSDREGSYSYHNHPDAVSNYSFGSEDVGTFIWLKEAYARASDSDYVYEMRRKPDTAHMPYEDAERRHDECFNEARQLAWDGELDLEQDGYHTVLQKLSEEMGFDYVRKAKHETQ